jgi:hypothetical protein
MNPANSAMGDELTMLPHITIGLTAVSRLWAISFCLTRESVKNGLEFDATKPISREYEAFLLKSNH